MALRTGTVPTFNFCTKFLGSQVIIHDRTKIPGNKCIDDLTSERSFDLQGMWVIGVFGLFSSNLPMGVYTTGNWQTGTGIKCLYYRVWSVQVCIVYVRVLL